MELRALPKAFDDHQRRRKTLKLAWFQKIRHAASFLYTLAQSLPSSERPVKHFILNKHSTRDAQNKHRLRYFFNRWQSPKSSVSPKTYAPTPTYTAYTKNKANFINEHAHTISNPHISRNYSPPSQFPSRTPRPVFPLNIFPTQPRKMCMYDSQLRDI